MKFVIRSSCTASEVGWGNVALVHLEHAELAQIVEWRAIYDKLNETSSCVAICFWHLQCWWYDDFNYDPESTSLLTTEQLAHLEDEGWVRVPDALTLEDNLRKPPAEHPGYKECRTEADRINVEQRGVTWRAHVKYADSADVETWLLPYEAFICELHGIDEKLEATCLECIARGT